MPDEEIERIKQEKLRKLYEQADQEQQTSEEEQRLQQEIEMLEQTVKSRMTKEALQRYSNIRIAHPELALNLLLVLARAIQANQIGVIDDSQLKEILKQMQSVEKKDFNIKIK